jgi:hypothetical protein
MMCYLVSEGATDNPASVFRGARVHFYRVLIDADFIRQHQAIVMGTLCLRNTVIETQQVCSRTPPCPEYNLPTRPIFDHYLNVVEFVQEGIRQGIKYFCNKLFKQVTFHADSTPQQWLFLNKYIALEHPAPSVLASCDTERSGTRRCRVEWGWLFDDNGNTELRAKILTSGALEAKDGSVRARCKGSKHGHTNVGSFVWSGPGKGLLFRSLHRVAIKED